MLRNTPTFHILNYYRQAKNEEMKIHHLINILIVSIFLSSCGMNSIEGMKNNIDEKSNEIADLKNYFIEIIPENYIVRIQYNSSKNVDLFVHEPKQDSTKREKFFGQWDVNFKDYKETPQTDYEKKYYGKTKSLELVKSKLNWTTEQELSKVLIDGHELDISDLKTTPKGLQEYWIQWKNKELQAECN